MEDINLMNNIKGIICLKETLYMKKELIKNNKKVFHLPIKDYSIPTKETIKTFNEIIDKNFPVLIYCHAGLGRTGTMSAIYLITHLGLTPKTSIEIIRKVTPNSIESNEQLNFIYSYKENMKFKSPQKLSELFLNEKSRLLKLIDKIY
jgi:protein-tyrosine phosphatase